MFDLGIKIRINEIAVAGLTFVWTSMGCADLKVPETVAGTVWMISDQPSATFGAGTTAEQVVGEIQNGRFLKDGTVLIGDPQRPALARWAPADGAVQWIGRSGEAPGEFMELTAWEMVDDTTVVALDAYFGRITWLRTNGSVLRTATIDPPTPLGRQIAALPERKLGILTVQIAVDSGGKRSITESVRVLGEDGRDVEVAPLRTYSAPQGFPPIFNAETVFGGRGGRAFWGAGTEPRLTGLGNNSDRSWPGVRHPVLESDRKAWIESRLAEMSPQRQAMSRDLYESLEAADSFPYYDRLLVDQGGSIWIRDYYISGGKSIQSWYSVESASEQPAARVTLPAANQERIDLLDLMDGKALVLHEDSLGVQTVRIYTLETAIE